MEAEAVHQRQRAPARAVPRAERGEEPNRRGRDVARRRGLVVAARREADADDRDRRVDRLERVVAGGEERAGSRGRDVRCRSSRTAGAGTPAGSARSRRRTASRSGSAAATSVSQAANAAGVAVPSSTLPRRVRVDGERRRAAPASSRDRDRHGRGPRRPGSSSGRSGRKRTVSTDCFEPERRHLRRRNARRRRPAYLPVSSLAPISAAGAAARAARAPPQHTAAATVLRTESPVRRRALPLLGARGSVPVDAEVRRARRRAGGRRRTEPGRRRRGPSPPPPRAIAARAAVVVEVPRC